MEQSKPKLQNVDTKYWIETLNHTKGLKNYYNEKYREYLNNKYENIN